MNRIIQNGTTLIDQFEQRARLQPNSIAIENENNRWTYGQLDARVSEIAECLVAKGVSPSTYVGVYVHPSADLIATLLATLKVGAAYVPVDRSAPGERLLFIATDANLRFVITDDTQLRSGLELRIHELKHTVHDPHASKLHWPSVGPDTHAYVIYTSGSSGQPKGVICTHNNVLRLFSSTDEQFLFSSEDRWTWFHSVAFDFSVWEIFGALLYGGTLVIVAPEVARDAARFAKLLNSQRITVLNQTPSAFYNLISAAASRNIDCFSTLRFVILGGERVQCAKLLHWFKRGAPECPKLINMYGITETTVHVTYREIIAEDVVSTPQLSPIGLPIRDLAVYLLNDDLVPVAQGEAGEICVAGPGVAKGYLNRPELTGKMFVPNPFDNGAQPMLYRSGDLGRRLPSGELCYLGRLDRQVKIRGYRIELGEIESVLLSAPGITTSYVTAIDCGTNDARLVAYVVPDAKLWPGAFLEADSLQRRKIRLLSLDNGLAVAYLNRSETLFLYDEIFRERLYEKLGITFSSGACIVDVGANIGMFCLFAMTKCRNPRLVAIEPIPACAEVLETNLTRYTANASVHKIGLSDHTGTAQFRYFRNATVMSGQYAGADEATAMEAYLENKYGHACVAESLRQAGIRKLVDGKLEYTDISCALDTLSALVERENLTRIDLLKIDVEKSELDVLNGIRDEHWPLIQQIVLEVHDIGGRLDRVRTLLKARGYSCCVEQDVLLNGTALCNLYARRESIANSTDVGTIPDEGDCVISSQGATLVGDLRASLARVLPGYMIPAQLHLLGELPLTINGKVDEKQLAAITPNRDHVARDPVDSIEQKVREICLEVLKLQEVDLDVSLADAGAQSLTLVIIAMRLYETFNFDISIDECQHDVSIASIAREIRKATQSQEASFSSHELHYG